MLKFGSFDKAYGIKPNLMYISIALFGSIIFCCINYFHGNFIQELINQSFLIQSIIVFLSIINIIYRFTLRRVEAIDGIATLIKKE
ncbi:MAG: hypothetical protein ACJA1Z_002145 [Patiriisocius sp.]